MFLWSGELNREKVIYLYSNTFILQKKETKGKGTLSFVDTVSIYSLIITRYRRIGYSLNVMRQSACLVFNPITVDNYAAFFNCTPVGRASDSMMAPT